jgi:hypothetical protein
MPGTFSRGGGVFHPKSAVRNRDPCNKGRIWLWIDGDGKRCRPDFDHLPARAAVEIPYNGSGSFRR